MSQRILGRGLPMRAAASMGRTPKSTSLNMPSVMKWMRSQRMPWNQGSSVKLVNDASSAASMATNR